MLDIVKGLLQPAVLSVITVSGFATLIYLVVQGTLPVMEFFNLTKELIFVGVGAAGAAVALKKATNGNPPPTP